MSEELKPCPFCGQQEAFVEQLDSDASVVICQGMVDEHSACLARGPVGVQQSDMEGQPGRDAAIAEWNRRAQPAEAEGAGVVAEAYSHRSRDSMKVTVMNIRQTGRLRDGDKLVRQVDHLAALSAVTAERDRLREENETLESQERYREQDRLVAVDEADQLRAEVEALREENQRLKDGALEDLRLRTSVLELMNALLAEQPEVHLNPADKLPPVNCPLLIEVMKGHLVLARRTGIIENKSADMEYRLVTGETIQGRFRWTYP